jgi:hypothetical protein
MILSSIFPYHMTLTPMQLQAVKEKYCDMIIDKMDMDDLMVMCYDLLMDSYEKVSEKELRAEVLDLYDHETWEDLMPSSPSEVRESLYDELVAYSENYDDL